PATGATDGALAAVRLRGAARPFLLARAAGRKETNSAKFAQYGEVGKFRGSDQYGRVGKFSRGARNECGGEGVPAGFPTGTARVAHMRISQRTTRARPE